MSFKVKKNYIAIILMVSLIGGMTLTKAIGVWSDKDGLTQAVNEAKKAVSEEILDSGNDAVEASAPDSVKLDISVSEIRGSSSFGQVSEIYGVSIDDFIKAFELDENTAKDMLIKDLEAIYDAKDTIGVGIGTASVRYFVALYNGVAYEKNEEYLPAPAVKLLKELNKLTLEEEEYLKTHTFVK